MSIHRPSWMNAFEARSIETPVSENDLKARNAFNRDLSIIVHSNYFKRLSHKTQVYALPFNDHVHTRLTHSIEASQIGRQICRYFCKQVIRKFLHVENLFFKLSSELEELTAAACLAHDIGHAPFGHKGKVILELFCNSKNEKHVFDDNKQVVRILLNEMWIEKIKPSGPFVASILKKKNYIESCYESERTVLEAIITKLKLNDIRHPVSIFMEAADDIAYLSGDLQDFLAIYSGQDSFKDKSKFSSFAQLHGIDSAGNKETKTLKTYFEEALQSSNEQKIQDFSDCFLRIALDQVFQVIDNFANLFLSESPTIENIPSKLGQFLHSNAPSDGKKKDENLVYSLCIGEKGQLLFDLKKQIYQGSILKELFIQEQDKLAGIVLNGILNELYELNDTPNLENSNIFEKLPSEVQEYFRVASKNKILFSAIIDFVSGMTDRYAIAFWKEITGLSAMDRLNAKPFTKIG